MFCNELVCSRNERKWKLCCCFIFYKKKAEAEAFAEQSANCAVLHVIKAAEQLSSVNTVIRPEVQLIQDYSLKYKVISRLLFNLIYTFSNFF